MLGFLHNKVFQFNGSVLGFEDFNEFLFTIAEENSQFGFLQSVENENVGFLVANPFYFYSEYKFEIEEKTKHQLKLQSSEEVTVLAIMTVREPFIKSTINLMAPLIINMTTGDGRQIILPPEYKHRTKEPLFHEEKAESGGSKC
ncbi:flagellar assembly protein FliW [Paenibacillus sp. sptzw28]|uniref:flagellar assembly protein FliW n=1 Tax=Paenibacillus sp. sptzw28 TaxID=715179 RepID=UPI001C6F0364|nr:flagellar assembly protein FliW [Paenibacillus sp. sptzw28]QYR22111.1 flagellar assembly protein FliW [Paenibacillus sp. sptzw28]